MAQNVATMLIDMAINKARCPLACRLLARDGAKWEALEEGNMAAGLQKLLTSSVYVIDSSYES